MGMNHTPIDSTMTKEKAIKQGGYYNTDGDWNCIVLLDEYPDKIFRGRVEVLVLQDGKLFMYLKKDGTYRVPGGGFDRGVLNKDQAFIETKEEAKMIISNIRDTGVRYTKFYKDKFHNTDYDIDYDGAYTEVYIADYKGDYEGRIRKGLSDNDMTNKGKFYDLFEIENILYDPHRQALSNILNNIVTESFINETFVNDLVITAEQFQKTLKSLHKSDLYHCINDINIDFDNNNGVLFAQYNTNNPSEVNDVQKFINYCNFIIRDTIYRGYVEEPQDYSSGFLYVKDNFMEESSVITEITNQVKNNKYPIFIINSFTNTTFGKLISLYTNSTYSHSSIALDPSLNELYSFNRNGFVRESISMFTELSEDARIQVRCLFVDKNDIEKIKEKLDYLWNHKNQSKYNLKNIIDIMINRENNTNNELSMVCSQFVSWLLNIADIKLLDKSINLITPKDLSTIEVPKLYLLYEGKCKEYDYKKIKRIFNNLKKNKSEFYKSN